MYQSALKNSGYVTVYITPENLTSKKNITSKNLRFSGGRSELIYLNFEQNAQDQQGRSSNIQRTTKETNQNFSFCLLSPTESLFDNFLMGCSHLPLQLISHIATTPTTLKNYPFKTSSF